MLVKRFKDFLLEKVSILEEDNEYYYKVEYHGRGDIHWVYDLYKHGDIGRLGSFTLGTRACIGVDPNFDRSLEHIIKPFKFIYLYSIVSFSKGLGVMLMSKVISETKKLGYDTIVLSVLPGSYDFKKRQQKLIEFYEHFGFKILYDDRKKDGHRVFMYLKID